MRFRWMVLGFSLFAVAGCSTPPHKPVVTGRGDFAYTKEYISWLIGREMRSADITGLSIALVDDQQVVWAQGFGYADKQARLGATADTVYHLGSIAKVFTATAAMQLVEQGKLDIDQPLQTYLPGFSIKSRSGGVDRITPRNIMTHHSGLPSNWVSGMSERHPGDFTEVEHAVRDEYLAYPPDYIFAYSNLGVTLLGTAIGKVGGQGYANYMERQVLQPLEMRHSEFASRIPGKSYDKGKEIEAFPLRDLPSGGMNSSANDLAHFMQMIFADGNYAGRQLLRSESLREMFRAQNEAVPMDFDFRMGLGWMLSGVEVPGAGVVASHGGTTLNSHTLMAVLPEHKLGVVVLSNSVTAQESVGKIAADTLRLALEAKQGIAPPAPVVVDAVELPLTDDDLRAYVGYFDTLVGLVKVSGRDGRLLAEIMGQKLELLPREEKMFGVRFKLFGFIPVKLAMLEELNLFMRRIDGHDVLALKRHGQSMLVGEKLEPVALAPHLLDYTGEYEIINKHDGPLPDSVRIQHEDGMLIGALTFPQKPGFTFRVAFRPVADDELVMYGLGPGKGETLRLKKVGDECRVLFSGFELRKKTAGKVDVQP